MVRRSDTRKKAQKTKKSAKGGDWSNNKLEEYANSRALIEAVRSANVEYLQQNLEASTNPASFIVKYNFDRPPVDLLEFAVKKHPDNLDLIMTLINKGARANTSSVLDWALYRAINATSAKDGQYYFKIAVILNETGVEPGADMKWLLKNLSTNSQRRSPVAKLVRNHFLKSSKNKGMFGRLYNRAKYHYGKTFKKNNRSNLSN